MFHILGVALGDWIFLCHVHVDDGILRNPKEVLEPPGNDPVAFPFFGILCLNRGFQVGLAFRLEPYLQVLPRLAAQHPNELAQSHWLAE